MSNEYQVVDCDECKQEFEIKQLDKRRLENSIEQLYFTCPHCQQEYTVTYTNTEIRRHQRTLQSQFERLKNTVGEKARGKLWEKIQVKRDQVAQMISELRQSIEAVHE